MADYDPSLEVECPVCGAMRKEKCAMLSGNFCSESHIDRYYVAEYQHHPKDGPNVDGGPNARKPFNNGRLSS